MKKDKEETTNLTIRIPISVKLRIEIEANKDGRTVNSYMNKLLKDIYGMPKK